MKRLLSILLMNAWNGLRKKASLPTATMVTGSVMALIVVGSVTAGASPDLLIPKQKTPSTSVQHPILSRTLALFGEHVDTAPKPKPKPTPHTAATPVKQPAKPINTTPVQSNPSSTSTTNMQQQPPQPAATVSLASVQSVCSQGQTTYSVSSAELDFTTPVVANGSVTWYWETDMEGSTATSPIADTQYTQQFTAGTTKVIFANSDVSQPLLSAPASKNFSYKFRLHVIAPVETTSPWFKVPQETTTTSCQ